MNFLKRACVCAVSVLFMTILAATTGTAISDRPRVLPEEVDKAFTEPESKRNIRSLLYGIVNGHRPDSQMTDIPLDRIFIGKKPFEYAFLKENGEFDYRNWLCYFVFGIDDTTAETVVFGALSVSTYCADNYSFGYTKGEPSTSAILCKSGPFAVFGYDETHKDQPTYWKTYAVNPSNAVYAFNDGIVEGEKVPKADYKALSDKDGRNIITAECFVPAYTLNVEPVSSIPAPSRFKVGSFSDEIQSGHTYLLRNIHSERYLEAQDAGIPSAVYQFNSDLAPNPENQKFKLVLAEKTDEAEYYSIIPVINEKARLDVDNASDKLGTKLKLYKANKAYPQAQLFRFIQNTDETYRIQPKLSQTRVLDIRNVSKEDKAEIHLFDFVNANSQKWVLIDLNDTSEKPVEFFSELPSYPKGTTSVRIYTTNNTDYQLSFITSYCVEKYDGEWKGYYTYNDPAEMAGFYISNTKGYDTLKVCGNETGLEPGTYRVVKTFSTKGNVQPYYAEFKVQ